MKLVKLICRDEQHAVNAALLIRAHGGKPVREGRDVITDLTDRHIEDTGMSVTCAVVPTDVTKWENCYGSN